jgi:anti-sigma regulatory factor (Ser/Thr protein kinase)
MEPERVESLRRNCRRALALCLGARGESRAVSAQAEQGPASRPSAGDLSVTLPVRAGSRLVARRLLRTFAGVRVPSDDLALLATEVDTNALEHGGLGPGDVIRVEARLRGGGLRVTVHDHSPGLGLGEVPLGPGLRIVDHLAARWSSEPGMVWFELRGARVGSADVPRSRAAGGAEPDPGVSTS